MTRIDAHVHTWDHSACDYPWLGPHLGELDRDYPLDELVPSLDAAGIDAVVLVQAADDDRDTAHMLAVADAQPRVVGVVGWLPLDRPDEVERRLKAGLDDRIVGIRALIHDMPDAEWILRDDVTRSLAHVAEAGLAFDVVTASPAALWLVPMLASRHPGLRIVIDHLGKPPIGGTRAETDEWGDLLADAARHPQVSAKVSGLAASTGAPDAWTPDDIESVIEIALEVFGPSRLLSGGDWPVSNLAGGYRRTHDAVDAVISRLSPSEADAVRGDTAARVYRLDPDRLAAARAATP
jgi:L-fuconolactonase